MENNQNKKNQSTFQQVFKSQLSKKLSVFMVLVSFFSFLLIGVTNVSYAAVTEIPEDTGLGDSFTTAPAGTQINSNTGFPVFMYSTSNGIPIFCLERDINYRGGITMSKKEQITDQGLLYVMAHTFPHVKFKDSKGTEFPDEVQTWITQATIWQYLYETGAANNATGSGNVANIENIKTAVSLSWDDEVVGCRVDGCGAGATSQATFYDTYIAPIVANARQSNVTANGTIDISLANQEMSITEDEKYYQTSLVTITNSDPGNFVSDSLKVEIQSAPDGTILIDENGQEIENYDNVTKFYVRIPVESVTEENKSVLLHAEGTFRGYDGYYYKADGAQTVSTVFTTDVKAFDDLDIPINYTPEVPDTSMSIAQSVYFIGLVVLLCGVGIIYANAKPRQKQQ
jgi:hypothetical protein